MQNYPTFDIVSNGGSTNISMNGQRIEHALHRIEYVHKAEDEIPHLILDFVCSQVNINVAGIHADIPDGLISTICTACPDKVKECLDQMESKELS